MNPSTTQKLINAIVPANNIYRDQNSSMREKLIALWTIGDLLVLAGVTAPHAVGWQIQSMTSGLIKRPTIFRGHKIRSIWASKEEMLAQVGGIKGLSYLIEMLPLIDPAQKARAKIGAEELESVFYHACHDKPVGFKRFLGELKSKFSHGRLGKQLDKRRHLSEMGGLVGTFADTARSLAAAFTADVVARDAIRSVVSDGELVSLSNMCIALTTKENFRLYKALPPKRSDSSNVLISGLYNGFRELLSKSLDTERARFRRLVSAEALAEISDLASSLRDEQGVASYRERRKLSFKLG